MTYSTRKTKPPIERFMAFVKEGPVPAHNPELGPCHLFTGSLYGDGYGKFWLDGRSVRAHRFALNSAGIDIPEGYEPDHLCRVRPCVRVDHMEVVTQQENLRRAGLLRRGRAIGNAAIQAMKTHCKHGHEFTAENTHLYDGKRVCRACWSRRQLRRKASQA